MEKIKKLAIITTHPIQYNAPFFRKLAESYLIHLKVFYTWDKSSIEKFDPGFGQKIAWDVPLLEGYDYTFVKNTSKNPGSHHFWGIQNPSLINEITSYSPNAILIYGWNYRSHLNAMLHFKNKIPIWFRGDSHLLNETSHIKTWCRRIILRWVYKYVDLAFFVGKNNKAYYLIHGMKENQLILMPHAVDNDFFQKNSLDKENDVIFNDYNLNISKNNLTLVYAGKFEAVKNLQLLIKAVQNYNNLNSILPEVHLILVGNGVQEKLLKNISKSNSYIHFLPFQNQSFMPSIYRLGDFVVLPSISETWGLLINEAMACGKPVIASDKVGGAMDLIIEKTTGLIFKNNDLTDLMQSINKAQNWKLSGIDQSKIIIHINNFNIKKNTTLIVNELKIAK